MKNLLKAEYIAIFVLAIILFAKLDYAWWWFPVLLLLPDIGMLGYIVNARIGAFTYNFLHFYGTAVGLYAVGYFYNLEVMMLLGVIVLAHIALDRFFGYGLKYRDSFRRTHLKEL